MKKSRYEVFKPYELTERIKKSPVAFVPLGLLEWHGNHLCLGTDYLISIEVCRKAASLVEGITLPGIYVGCRGYTSFEGTLTFSRDTASKVLCELLGELYKIGIRLAVIVTIHSGAEQEGMLEDVVSAYSAKKTQMKVLGINPCRLVESAFSHIYHGGVIETSIVMAISEEDVDLGKFDFGTIKVPKYSIPDSLLYRKEKLERWQWEENVPASASAELGEEVLNAMCASLKNIVEKDKEVRKYGKWT